MRRSMRKRSSTREPTTAPPRFAGTGRSPAEKIGPLRLLLAIRPRQGSYSRPSQPAWESRFLEDSPVSGPRRNRSRPTRRPERQQIMLRRGLALVAGLIVLILIVLGVRGCLNARQNRALSDYAGNVTQIVEET